MLILVTGGSGQLAKSIQSLVIKNKTNHDFIFISRSELDLADLQSVRSYFNKNKFDLIINCAAYTKVDKAETDQEQANLVNHLAVEKISEIAKKNNTRLIHISTDFVFDGNQSKPYLENDSTSPLNIYGATKLAGENAILSIMKFNAIIIRTSWVYSEYGNNFVDTILRLIKKKKELHIVSDQIGSPTFATDLAQVILFIVTSEKLNSKNLATEVYHYSNEGKCSWYDFTKEIVNISGLKCNIKPINTKDYPAQAERPKYVVMSKKKIIQEFDLKINFWQDSLKHCITNLSESSTMSKE